MSLPLIWARWNTRATLQQKLWGLPFERYPAFLLHCAAAGAIIPFSIEWCSGKQQPAHVYSQTPWNVKSMRWSEKTLLFLQKLLRYSAGPHWAVSIFRSHCYCRKEQPQLSLMWLNRDFHTHFIQRAHWELPLPTTHRCRHEPGETGFNKTELTTLGDVVKCCINISRNTLRCIFCKVCNDICTWPLFSLCHFRDAKWWEGRGRL